MGLADLLGTGNPFQQYVAANRGKLGQLGAGLASGQNLSAGLANAAQMQPDGARADDAYATAQKADAERQKQLNQTIQYLQSKHPDIAQAVQSGLPIAKGWSEALQRDGAQSKTPTDMSSSAQGRQQLATQYGLSGDEANMYVLTGKLPGANDSTKYGNSPIYARNPQTGEYIAIQPGSDGSLNNLSDQLPPGYVIDPGALNSDRAAGTAFGGAQGSAQFTLPAAKQNVETELSNIHALKTNAQGLEETFGNAGGIIPQQWTGAMPGTAKQDYATQLDQVAGQNFLQAFASLKGAGAITEMEGAKAQAALARLNTKQSKGAYLKALDELEIVLKTGYERMASQASAGPYQSSGYQAPPLGNGGRQTSTGVTYSVDQ